MGGYEQNRILPQGRVRGWNHEARGTSSGLHAKGWWPTLKAYPATPLDLTNGIFPREIEIRFAPGSARATLPSPWFNEPLKQCDSHEDGVLRKDPFEPPHPLSLILGCSTILYFVL